jgi:hypothetical protein
MRLLLLLVAGPLLYAADPVYAPLWLYQGTWTVKPKSLAADAKPDQLLNQCGLIGKYFACQQTVNGKVSAMIVFVPAETAGHYYTQAVMPLGWAGGRGELAINGDHWEYRSKSEEAGKTTYYRTTNDFTGKDRIRFEISESADGEHWVLKNSGEEWRADGGKGQP